MCDHKQHLFPVLIVISAKLKNQDSNVKDGGHVPEHQMRVPSMRHISLILEVLQVQGECPDAGRAQVQNIPFIPPGRVPVIN